MAMSVGTLQKRKMYAMFQNYLTAEPLKRKNIHRDQYFLQEMLENFDLSNQ